MHELDIVRDLARESLTIGRAAGRTDSSLWDRTQRLARNVELICKLPEVTGSGLQIDRFCLMVATYFSDSGLAYHIKSAVKGGQPVIYDSGADELLDYCTTAVEENFSSVMAASRVNKINRIITESHNSFTNVTEAMILSDARNLDDMGATGIFNELRRYIIGGKGVSDALKLWKSKVDYRYWEAHLKDNFRFGSVQKLAEQRLSTAEYFMDQLKVEHTAEDMEKLISEPLEGGE